ncbi:MAG: rod shape-determining protein MreC [Nocardioidaceae bacterium]|nr:rod shape-determining protein MreC [Nocardioidaceae bacterium]
MPPSPREPDGRRSPRVLVLLLLTALAVLSLDAGLGPGAVSDPVRRAAGTVLGPAEGGASGLLAPVRAIGDLTTGRGTLRERNAALEAENARLRDQLGRADVDRNRLAEYDGLAASTSDGGLQTVQARVVGLGGAQSFSRTATIDKGTDDGVGRDMTVLSADGLVGRVLRATASHATVLLLVDKGSTVGGRLGSDNELGFLRGDGSLAGAGRLTLTTVDSQVAPDVGDSVVSWGSPGAVPYVAGVPVGRVEKVSSSPRQQTRSITVAPYVDFSSLDVVGVVVGNAATTTSQAQGE